MKKFDFYSNKINRCEEALLTDQSGIQLELFSEINPMKDRKNLSIKYPNTAENNFLKRKKPRLQTYHFDHNIVRLKNLLLRSMKH